MARVAQNIETSLDSRIEYATWPETVAYLSTAAMDSRCAGQDLKELYQHSFREYLDQWTGMDLSEQPEPIRNDPELSDYQLDRLDDLRFGIKKDRDKHFVDEKYDELGVTGVPKTFWLTQHELEQRQDDPDDMAQSALEDYI